jgi:DNA-binding NarL/FixJ family response regulator
MLVDNHSVKRKGLSSLLSRRDGIEVVAQAADTDQAIEQAQHIIESRCIYFRHSSANRQT